MKVYNLIAAALMLVTPVAVTAQDNEKPVEKHHAHIFSALALTPEQQAKWKSAEQERINANEPLKQKLKGSTTPDERQKVRDEMHVNQKKFKTSVYAFLTPVQITKFDSITRHNKRMPRGKRR